MKVRYFIALSFWGSDRASNEHARDRQGERTFFHGRKALTRWGLDGCAINWLRIEERGAIAATRRLRMSSSDRIQKQVILRAPVARVWRAIADAKEFGSWFGFTLEGPFLEGQTVKGTFDGKLDEA